MTSGVTVGIPAVSRRGRTAYRGKRVIDVVLASAALLLGAPLFALICLGIALTSRGPVVFRQERLGLGAAPFTMFKFRTMRTDATDEVHRAYVERLLTEAEPPDGGERGLYKLRNDSRVTRVGGLLRRASLDELPQLVNVFRGEMSLVGPRPLPLRDFEKLAEWHKKRYLVLPGLTGLWQVSGRSELDFDDLVRLDFYYLENWSIWLDVTILFKTPVAVASRRGAY